MNISLNTVTPPIAVPVPINETIPPETKDEGLSKELIIVVTVCVIVVVMGIGVIGLYIMSMKNRYPR